MLTFSLLLEAIDADVQRKTIFLKVFGLHETVMQIAGTIALNIRSEHDRKARFHIEHFPCDETELWLSNLYRKVSHVHIELSQ